VAQQDAAGTEPEPAAGRSPEDVLLEPVDLGPLRARNRLAMSAHTGALPHDRYVAYLAERAAGGVGLIVVGGANAGLAEWGPLRGLWRPGGAAPAFDVVGPNPATADGIAYYDGHVVPMLRERAEAVHAGGALAVGQVFHLGAYREVDSLQAGVGPSAGPDPDGFGTTYELTPRDIEELVTAYAAAARRTKLAGLDGAEIHAAHGFLVQAFLSPQTNRRDDEWGGPLANRARFLLRVLAACREAVGPAFPLGIRVGVNGLSLEDLVEVCRMTAPDLAYVSVSGGSVSGTRDGLAYASTRFEEPGHNLAVAAAVRAAVDVPVLAAGRILTPARAAAAVESGACDMVAMARPFIADPQWTRKLATGRAADIRPCVSANECHLYHGARSHMTCAVNPRAGREAEATGTATARAALRIVVVGAGPAGMEAAVAASRAGHRVTLVERSDAVGGRLALLARDPSQDRLHDYLEYARRRLDRAGVDVRPGTDPTVDDLLADDPAVVIVATGSASPPGLTYADVLAGAAVGHRVLVVGGLEDHLETLSAAVLLSARGHEVEATTEWDRHGAHADPMTRIALMRLLRGRGVVLRTGVRYAPGGLTDVLTGLVEPPPYFDSVVMCGGRTARTGLQRLLRERHPRVVAIGDCLAPRRIVHAVLDGYRVGSTISAGQPVTGALRGLDGPISKLQ
jgi:2,4-dienoyl-CoA reductase-like NADH-dependent reductase (Old Yellow Enzyme family)/threonine dehydrogenase-like Zn-dependent dehydrogenase